MRCTIFVLLQQRRVQFVRPRWGSRRRRPSLELLFCLRSSCKLRLQFRNLIAENSYPFLLLVHSLYGTIRNIFRVEFRFTHRVFDILSGKEAVIDRLKSALEIQNLLVLDHASFLKFGDLSSCH